MLRGMGYVTIPNKLTNVRATERMLDAVYASARVGLKGDSLALSAGLLPSQFRQLAQLDPEVDLAVQKGRADSELEHATMLSRASLGGDAKASLAILQHLHGWESKAAQQQFGVNGVTVVIGTVGAAKEISGEVIDQ